MKRLIEEAVSWNWLLRLMWYRGSKATMPEMRRRKRRTKNRLEQVLRVVRRRTQVVSALPDGPSALMLIPLGFGQMEKLAARSAVR